jgi:hypothetical protein
MDTPDCRNQKPASIVEIKIPAQEKSAPEPVISSSGSELVKVCFTLGDF